MNSIKTKAKPWYVPTGLKDVDNILAGLPRSDLIIIAARPSMGKTALTLNLALQYCQQSPTTASFDVCPRNGAKEQLVDRMYLWSQGLMPGIYAPGICDNDFDNIGRTMGTLSQRRQYLLMTHLALPSVTYAQSSPRAAQT